jgi:two-component system nitrogen regulation sensor histidine kinase GlnL
MEPPALDALATPIAWADDLGRIVGCNTAFARWLGVSGRRLESLPVQGLDAEDGRLEALLAGLRDDEEPVRTRRMRLRAPNGAERFADIVLAREASGVRIEAYPVEEFPGADPASALPAALHAALKGLAHEIRNPLAGLKGAAQLGWGAAPRRGRTATTNAN